MASTEDQETRLREALADRYAIESKIDSGESSGLASLAPRNPSLSTTSSGRWIHPRRFTTGCIFGLWPKCQDFWIRWSLLSVLLTLNSTLDVPSQPRHDHAPWPWLSICRNWLLGPPAIQNGPEVCMRKAAQPFNRTCSTPLDGFLSPPGGDPIVALIEVRLGIALKRRRASLLLRR